jgi:phage terminase Nu1 subunit (DNA packaging protein)
VFALFRTGRIRECPARGGGKGNEVLYDSAATIEWYSTRDAAIENEKLRKEVEDLALLQSQIFSRERLNMNVIA